jgi:hypothetical protein
MEEITGHRTSVLLICIIIILNAFSLRQILVELRSNYA